MSKPRSRYQTPIRSIQHPKIPKSGRKGHWCCFTFVIERILRIGAPKTRDSIQIKIKLPNPSQEPSLSSKVQNQNLKYMDVLCTFKIMRMAKIGKIDVPRASVSDDIQIKLKIPNLQNQDSQNTECGCTKDRLPFPNQDRDANPQSGSSSILQSLKSWLKGHVCSLQLQNKDKKPNLEHGCNKASDHIRMTKPHH